MIPVKEREVEIAGNIIGEDIRMTIDENAVEHLIGLLTDLYSDPEMAVIREISCNAFDAHVAAGNTEPISVTLPTQLNPVFIVQDWGIGLNADDFRNIYSKYGNSTKRGTNDQIGSLGLGCKSPLTYTNQFTVVGVKDGIRTTALVTRDKSNLPVLTIVDAQPTDDPNGVMVSLVATTNLSSFEEKARKFFSFWDAATVLLNGSEPDKQEIVTTWDSTDVYWSPNRYAENYIVMGNVAYPIDRSKYMNLIDNYGIIIHVSMGAVHFTPNREELHYTQRTIDVLDAAFKITNIKMHEWIEADIINQPTRPETLRCILKWKKTLYYNHRVKPRYESLKRDGEDIPTSLRPDPKTDFPFGWTPGKDRLTQYNLFPEVDIKAVNSYWVQGFNRNYTLTVKKKLWAHLNSLCIKYPSNFYFVEGKITNPWIDPDRILDWEDIDKIKLVKPGTAKTRATAYEGWLSGNTTRIDLEVGDIQGHGGIQLYSLNKEMPFGYAALTSYYPKHSLVLLSSRQVNKFKRLFPKAMEYHIWASEQADKWWKSLSPSTRSTLANLDNANMSARFHVDQIKDPELKAVLESKKVISDKHKVFHKYFNYRLHEELYRIKFSISEEYPLVTSSHTDLHKTHNTLYVNAIWENKNKQCLT